MDFPRRRRLRMLVSGRATIGIAVVRTLAHLAQQVGNGQGRQILLRPQQLAEKVGVLLGFPIQLALEPTPVSPAIDRNRGCTAMVSGRTRSSAALSVRCGHAARLSALTAAMSLAVARFCCGSRLVVSTRMGASSSCATPASSWSVTAMARPRQGSSKGRDQPQGEVGRGVR